MEKSSNIFVAGHRGLVGSAILRKLKSLEYLNLLTKTRSELDLTNKENVESFFENNSIEYVFLAAAKVGGIVANNTYPAQFLYENLQIQNNVIHSAYKFSVKKLLFLGSSCVYPKFPQIPIKEESLMTGILEETNEAYAIAKIAGIKMCQAYRKEYGCNFISVMPTNIYGPNDNYHPQNSHVLAALIKKFVEAKQKNSPNVVLWGTGEPKREFLHVDDLADACLYLMKSYDSSEIINIGSGKEISINELADKIRSIVGIEIDLDHDLTKPDGTPRKVMDISKIKNLGWYPKISLQEGLKSTILDFTENHIQKVENN